MPITRLTANNFTVFNRLDISFSYGINVFIGDNGTGKTHLLKALYAFCECDKTPFSLDKRPNMGIEDNVISSSEFTISFFHNSFFEMLQRYFLVDSIKALYNGYQNEPSFSITYVSNKEPFQFESTIYKQNMEHSELCDINAAFIPAKEMLTHSRIEKDYAVRKVPFDETLIDIINKTGSTELRKLDERSRNIMNSIENIIRGKVFIDKDIYYISRGNVKYSFQVEAEGYKKFAALLRLVETGALANGSILFWDEPEVNINPQNIPALVDILVTLQEMDVQIFIATHDYILAKYLEVRINRNNGLLFHALYKDPYNDNGAILSESDKSFTALKNNDIVKQSIALYEEEVEKVLG